MVNSTLRRAPQKKQTAPRNVPELASEASSRSPVSGTMNAARAEIMKKIGNARNGDTVAIDFTTDGVGVSFNGEARGKVASASFARALLKVWLGENSVDASLKKALLGG